MKKTIYNIAVLMESQEQCDRMKQICIDNGLPIWENEIAFLIQDSDNDFGFGFDDEFYVGIGYDKTKVTESEFIELLKQEKS